MTVKELRDKLGFLVAGGDGDLPGVFEFQDAMGDGESVNFAVTEMRVARFGEECAVLA